MAALGAAVATDEALDRAAERGSPAHSERHVVGAPDRGAPWRDLPRHYGPVGTVSSRFYRWRAAGIWDQVLMALQAEADARGEVDWDLHFVDATVIRAHQHAAGACRDGAAGDGKSAEALGRSQGGAHGATGSRPSCTCGLRAAASRSSPC